MERRKQRWKGFSPHCGLSPHFCEVSSSPAAYSIYPFACFFASWHRDTVEGRKGTSLEPPWRQSSAGLILVFCFLKFFCFFLARKSLTLKARPSSKKA